jgi:hypothetical protein
MRVIARGVMKVVCRVAHPGAFRCSRKGYSKEDRCIFRVGAAAFLLLTMHM